MLVTARGLVDGRPKIRSGTLRGSEEGLSGLQCGCNFKNTVASVIALGANGLRVRVKGVKDFISADYIRVGGGGEFVGAVGVKIGELGANGALGTSGQVRTEAVQNSVDGRGTGVWVASRSEGRDGAIENLRAREDLGITIKLGHVRRACGANVLRNERILLEPRKKTG